MEVPPGYSPTLMLWMTESQRTTCRSWFSLPIKWILGFKLKSSDLIGSTFVHGRTSPNFFQVLPTFLPTKLNVLFLFHWQIKKKKKHKTGQCYPRDFPNIQTIDVALGFPPEVESSSLLQKTPYTLDMGAQRPLSWNWPESLFHEN